MFSDQRGGNKHPRKAPLFYAHMYGWGDAEKVRSARGRSVCVTITFPRGLLVRCEGFSDWRSYTRGRISNTRVTCSESRTRKAAGTAGGRYAGEAF